MLLKLSKVCALTGSTGFGIQIVENLPDNVGNPQGVRVQSLTQGSVADASGNLCVGDRILSANKIQLLSAQYKDAVNALTKCKDLEMVVSTDSTPLPVYGNFDAKLPHINGNFSP